MEETRLGPYRIIRQIGTGGMATVYLAKVEAPAPGVAVGERVALKIVHPHLLANPGFFKRFLREAEAGRGIQSPNVVRTYDADAVDVVGHTKHFLVLEFVEGQSLHQLREELGWLPENLCRHIGREVAKGLAAIHAAGVVHRDLKPDNVLITPEEEVKVTDLGVARIRDNESRLSSTGQFVGSVLYASPEQFDDRGLEIDGRADLYCLGLLLYEIATGEHPYSGAELPELMRCHLETDPEAPSGKNPQISPFLEEVILTLLRKEPDRRFQVAEELLEVLVEGEDSAWWRSRSSQLRQATHRPLRRIRIPRETRLFGRAEDLSRLRDLWGHVKEGEGQVLLLVGEAGIGKSRLVDEFAAGLEEQGEDLNFLFGTFPPGGAATEIGAYTAAIREHLGEADLEEELLRLLPSTPLLVPALAALILGRPLPPGQEPLDKDALQTVFVHCVRSLAAERPTLILIDDLHFAPEGGRALFAALAMAVSGHRTLLVGTSRPGLSADWKVSLERLPHISQLALDRLGIDTVRHLLTDALCSERVVDEILVEVSRRSDGNPFFLFEIMRGLREQGVLITRTDGRWTRVGEVTELRIPRSVKDLVAARVGRLEEDDRDVLEVASCAGFEFDPMLVADALGRGHIPILKSLSRLEQRQRLVHSSGREFVFDHHQVQEVLYEGLPDALRGEYHVALARALERREDRAGRTPADARGVLAVELAEHFYLGRRGVDAHRYLTGALDHLEECFLHVPAARLAALALAAEPRLAGVDRASVLLRQAKHLEHLSRSEEDSLREALVLADQAGDSDLGMEIRVRLAAELQRQGRGEESRAVAEKLLETARGAENAELTGRALGMLGSHDAHRGRFDDARAYYDQHLEVARAAGDLRGEASATGNLALVAWESGSNERALDLFNQALALFEKGGTRRGVGTAIGNRGLVNLTLGNHDEARRDFQRHRDISREVGYRRGEAMAIGNLGMVYQELGRLAEARRSFDDDLEISRELGNPMHECVALQNRGYLATWLGELDLARELLSSSQRICREIDYRWGFAYARNHLGLVAENEGNLERARGLYEEARSIRRELDILSDVGSTELGLARVLIALGETAEAERLLVDCHRLAADGGILGRASIATLLLRLGGVEEDEARGLLAEAGTRLRVRDRMQCRLDLFLSCGRREDLEEARGLLDFLFDHAPSGVGSSMRERVALHREILAREKGEVP